MYKCSSQPRPECWKPQEITAGSTPAKFQKKKEREADAEPKRAAVGLVSDGRWRAKFTLVTTTAETQNRACAGNKRAAGSGKCVWQERTGRLTSWLGANISLGKRNYSYKGSCHLEDEERQKQGKKTKKTDRRRVNKCFHV